MKNWISKIVNKQAGFTLVEVLIALFIMGFTAVFIGGTYTSFVGNRINEESINLERIAKSQMDDVKAQTYDEVNNPPVYNQQTEPGYSISISAERLDSKGDGFDTDDGIQKITIQVYKDTHPEHVFTLMGYKLKP